MSDAKDLITNTSAALANLPVSRRKLIAAGGAAIGLAAAGIAGASLVNNGQGAAPSPTPAQVAQAAPTKVSISTPPASTPAPAQAAALPKGMALVTSPRLPLWNVAASEWQGLIQGETKTWRDVGCPVGLPVSGLAIDGLVPAGLKPAKVVNNYDELVTGLNASVGAIAMIPVDQVDFRVSVLSVDGVNPLTSGGTNGMATLGFVGDIVPGRNVAIHMRKFGDPTHPFHKVKEMLKRFDLTIANLEGDLSSNIPPPEEADPNTFDFIADPAMIDGFKLAGIDVVTMANNHTVWNDSGRGLAPFLDTVAALEAAAFDYFGAGSDLDRARQAFVTKVNGLSIAITGIDGVTANMEQQGDPGVLAGSVAAGASNPGTNPFDTPTFLGDISALAGQHDIVIPYFHMGREYIGVLPGWALQAARSAIDAGAAMVVTNHPHVIQGMEIYKGKPIVYSPGNFIFDQMFSVDTRQGHILDLTFKGSKVVGLRTHGVEIVDFNQPRLMSPGEQAALMDRFWRATDVLAGG